MTVSMLSNYAGDRALAYLLGHGGWIAAHTTDPGPTGDLSTEVAGGGYVRQFTGFAVPSGRSTITIGEFQIPGMPAVIVEYLGIWDAVSNGHLIFRVELSPPITVLASAALVGQNGDIGITI